MTAKEILDYLGCSPDDVVYGEEEQAMGLGKTPGITPVWCKDKPEKTAGADSKALKLLVKLGAKASDMPDG